MRRSFSSSTGNRRTSLSLRRCHGWNRHSRYHRYSWFHSRSSQFTNGHRDRREQFHVNHFGFSRSFDRTSFPIRYIMDAGNNRVQRFPPGSTTGETVAAMAFNAPRGMRVDSIGNIYIADSSNHRIIQFRCGASSPISSFVPLVDLASASIVYNVTTTTITTSTTTSDSSTTSSTTTVTTTSTTSITTTSSTTSTTAFWGTTSTKNLCSCRDFLLFV